MKKTAFSLLFATVVGCSNSTGGPGTAKPQPPIDPTRISVQMTSVTLGEDCHGGGIPDPVPMETPLLKKAAAPAKSSSGASFASEMSVADMGERACEQTSIQLAIVSPASVPGSELRVKKVELFDENGKLVGPLTPKSPVVWTTDAYKPWDEKVPPGQTLSVSYPLSQPNWPAVEDRHNKTFTVKVVLSIGGVDQPLQRDVHIYGESRLPPGAVT